MLGTGAGVTTTAVLAAGGVRATAGAAEECGRSHQPTPAAASRRGILSKATVVRRLRGLSTVPTHDDVSGGFSGVVATASGAPTGAPHPVQKCAPVVRAPQLVQKSMASIPRSPMAKHGQPDGMAAGQ